MNGNDQIITPADLLAIARDLKVRDDWHEPDEQGLTVEIRGRQFDNAGFWGGPNADPGDFRNHELHVVLWKQHPWRRKKTPVASVNLATLFAWATEYAKTLETG